jgi:DNA-binding XRE family transcriptional regulator
VKIKLIDSKKILNASLKNSEFKKEFDSLEKEFQISKEVIALRLRENLTQTQLAKMVGTSQPSIARLESGTYKNLSLSFLRKVGDALGAYPEVHFRPFENKRPLPAASRRFA